MRCLRFVRAVLYALVIAAVLTLIAVVGVTLYATPERVGAKIAASLETSLGWRLAVPVPVSIKRFPKLVAEFPANDLLNREGVRLAHFEGLTVEMNAFAAFAQTPRIDAIAVESLEGAFDLDALRTVLAAQRSGAAARSASLWDDVKRLSQEDGRKAAGGDQALWSIGGVRLHNAHLTIEGLLPEGELSLSGLDAVLENVTESNAALRLAGAFEAAGNTGDLTLAANLAWDRDGALRAAQATMNAKGLRRGQAVDLQGCGEDLIFLADGFEASRLQAQASLAGGSALWIEAKNVMLSAENSRAALAVRFNAPHNGRTMRLAGDALLRRQGADSPWGLENISLRSQMEGDEAQSLLVGRVLADRRLERGEINASGSILSASASLQAAFSLNAGRPKLVGMLRLGGLDAAPGALMIGRTMLNAVDFSGHAELSGIRMLPDLEKLSGELEIKDGALRFDADDAALFGGRAEIAAASSPNGQWDASLKITNADAQNLAKNWMKASVVSGRASLLLSAAGTLSDGPAEHVFEINDLAGMLRVENGELLGIDAPLACQVLLDERADEPPAESLAADAKTPFESFDAMLRLDPTPQAAPGASNTVVRLTDGVLIGSGWRGQMEGVFAGNSLTADAVFLFTQGNSAELPALPLAARLARSSDQAPHWTWDWQQALDAAQNEYGPTELTAENILKRLRRSLKNFWSDLDFSTDWSVPSFSLPDWKMPEWKLPAFLGAPSKRAPEESADLNR